MTDTTKPGANASALVGHVSVWILAAVVALAIYAASYGSTLLRLAPIR